MTDESLTLELEEISAASEPNIIEPKDVKCPDNFNAIPFAVDLLKKLQNETRTVEVEFFEHVYKLETEFQLRHESVYKKRFDIINGNYVPSTFGNQSVDKTIDPPERNVQTLSGVPRFWLNVLTSSLTNIHENDRPILKHLTDVRARNKPLSELGFILEFHFSPNEFFENAVLRKEYVYNSSDYKMIHEVPLINKSVGADIKWKEGKVPLHQSWFAFLESSKIVADSDEEFMAYISGIQEDFELGYFIKEHVIPKAFLYFTGEEKNCFTISNYNLKSSWSPISLTPSESSTDDSEEPDNVQE